ncbi:Ribosomal protein S6 kinase alpha-5 [Madurella mycetomatis]|uniref:Ribosomal protein S6 kinase alpha-5 n=1 Tax=Madurella mycetomatis TaxID=100816 RepID=A0A175W975_9PEZI|nr:Ribosomal protein S6 kinase alpha-5 [Madurella mycetomatis]
MELNSTSIHDAAHPTAAFSQNRPQPKLPLAATAVGTSWAESQLNPKNRIDSLDPPLNPLWRIDGCAGLGTQYYAVPLFLGHVVPMRFDVFIPEEAGASPLLRHLLDLDTAFHTRDATRLRRLGISRHILRTLQAWTLGTGGVDDTSVASMYKNLPFGSRIVFENLDANVRNIKVTIAPTHYVEKQLLGLAKLDGSLGLPPETLPEAIDISRLSIVQQLHDSVCVVHKRTNEADDAADQRSKHAASRLWILKALTSNTKYLYTELRNLLQMEPHPHVISRPEYLVTKYCRFGGKTAVVGFLLPYHAKGSLRDTLPLLRMQNRLTLEMQMRWATQLASGMLHVRERGRIFYPDLRLDNIVVSAAGDVVMVDFEQRGVWCEFAAPEVNALEYARILASDESIDGDSDHEGVPAIPRATREHFAAILSRLLPDWEALQASEEYAPLPHGYANYNIPWLCMDETEQEAAEVYMLGRVLWCIFEGQSAPQRAAVWQSYPREPDIEFPQFVRTPTALRDLIDRCTRGRRQGLSSLVIRRGSKLVLLGREGGGSPDEVVAAAREWWRNEVAAAERFLEMREEERSRGTWNGNHFGRPRLREVLGELEQFCEGMGTPAGKH